MSKGNSRKPSSEFKAKVALEAIKSDKTFFQEFVLVVNIDINTYKSGFYT